MLFDINPKERVSDLYDRKAELEKLSQAIKHDERLSIIYGVRRVGKTSLIHAFLSEHEIPYILIDAREIYTKHTSVSISALYELIGNGFLNFVEKFNLDTEENLENKYSDIISSTELTQLLKGINEWCQDKKLKYAIVIDEAQYLRFGGSVKYDMMIAWSIDNLANIIYILTGSEVGMLKGFLDYENIKAPLYGRFRNEIYLEKFDKKTSENFLSKGFEELKKDIDKSDLEETFNELGGVVGWLTYYGHYRGIGGLDHKTALKNVFDEGSKIVISEIEGLIARSRSRYLSLLSIIADGSTSWSSLKNYAIGKTGLISDTRLNALLQNLVKFGIIEKTERETYVITDPIVIRAIKKINRNR